MDHKKSLNQKTSKPPAGDNGKKAESEGLQKLPNIDQEKPVDQQPPAGSSIKKEESEGLKKLTNIDQVIIKLTKNKCDVVKDNLGNNLFIAEEESSDCCTRICCGAQRPFDMELKDEIKKVIHLKSPMKCQTCCFPGCLQYLEVSLPDGTIVGTVEQGWSMCYSTYNICNQKGNVVMKITSPFCTIWNCSFPFCDDMHLTLPDGKIAGKISKVYNDVVVITFPRDLDVHSKGTLIGAAMLIGFMTSFDNMGCLDILLCNACMCLSKTCIWCCEYCNNIFIRKG